MLSSGGVLLPSMESASFGQATAGSSSLFSEILGCSLHTQAFWRLLKRLMLADFSSPAEISIKERAGVASLPLPGTYDAILNRKTGSHSVALAALNLWQSYFLGLL